MELPSREEIKVWIKTETEGREWLADQCGVAKTTIDQWLSKKDIPIAQHHKIAKLMEGVTEDQDDTSHIRIPFTDELLEKAHQAAAIVSTEFQDFCSRAIEHRAHEIISSQEGSIVAKITKIPQKKAHTMAAAGSGIEAEILDWDGESRYLNVRVGGLSMFPTLNDDDVVTFKNKAFARSPFMKKGLIYLVRYKGEQIIKEYQTRKATPEEEGAPYLTNFGTVGVLVSHNPDKETYPDIDITDNERFEWVAWLDEE